MAAATNSLNRAVGWFSHAPLPLHQRLVTALFTHAVPFSGTAGVRFEGLTAESATVALANRRRVQNHIHGVHAAATALLAETATGAVFAFNLPNGRLPLLKSLHVDYLRRAAGSLRAVATLPAADRQRMQSDERGEAHVPVIITDAAGEQPVACELVWAWVPKR